MIWIHAALWGLFGSFAVEGLDLYGAVRRRGCWPWQVRGPREIGVAGYLVAELVRLAIGGGLAWSLSESKQITTAVGAVAVGVAAPLIVERLARAIPLADPVQDTPAATVDTLPIPASGGDLNGHQTSVDSQRARASGANENVVLGDDWPDRVGE